MRFSSHSCYGALPTVSSCVSDSTLYCLAFPFSDSQVFKLCVFLVQIHSDHSNLTHLLPLKKKSLRPTTNLSMTTVTGIFLTGNGTLLEGEIVDSSQTPVEKGGSWAIYKGTWKSPKGSIVVAIKVPRDVDDLQHAVLAGPLTLYTRKTVSVS